MTQAGLARVSLEVLPQGSQNKTNGRSTRKEEGPLREPALGF